MRERKDRIDRLYEGNDNDGDLDSHRGSFSEFYRLQKVMQNLGDEDANRGTAAFQQSSENGYVTGALLANSNWNGQDEMPDEDNMVSYDSPIKIRPKLSNETTGRKKGTNMTS